MREELLKQACEFLKDSKVESAPLSKKIQFLEGKGLSPVEIEEALKRASGADKAESNLKETKLPQEPPKSPKLPRKVTFHQSKRPFSLPDLLIWGTLIGSISWLLSYTLRKWNWPFAKENTNILDEICKVKEVVEEMKKDHEAVKKELLSQCSSMRLLVDESKKKLEQWSYSEKDAQDQISGLTESIEKINQLLPKIQTSTHDQLKQSISEWEDQLLSLKTLLTTKSEDIFSLQMKTETLNLSQLQPQSEPQAKAWENSYIIDDCL